MTSTASSLFPDGITSVPRFFRDHFELATTTAISYFTERSGRYFDEIARLGNAYRLDGSEIAAATCLSLKFDHERVSRLFSVAEQIDAALAQIPVDLHLWDAPIDLLEDGSPLFELYTMIDDLADFGAAYTSKILAAKRPHLVPIRDRDVSRLLGDPTSWWISWRTITLQEEFRKDLEHIRSTLRLPHVSLLRIADVVLWELAVDGATTNDSNGDTQ